MRREYAHSRPLTAAIFAGILIIVGSLFALPMLVSTANAAEPVITRANYVGGIAGNSPALLFIHGSFGVARSPIVTLGDISTATKSGTPATPDLVVTSFSATDIVVKVSHPADSGLAPASYLLSVKSFDSATRESEPADFVLALGSTELGFVEFVGAIDAIQPQALTVAGRTVEIDAHTIFGGAGNPKSVADLLVGASVDVTSRLQADGTFLATSIIALP
jgi:hypothetical protein